MSKFRSLKVRNVVIVVIVSLVLLFSISYYVKIEMASESSSTTSHTQVKVGGIFIYPISIDYSGSWRLTYWGQNGTVTQYNETQYDVNETLSGSGNYEKDVKLVVVSYVIRTLCASATKLDLQSNSTLALSLLTTTNSTTASDPSVEVCASLAV